MSANSYRSQLERKWKERLDAERKAGEYRNKETTKRSAAAQARAAASKASSLSTAKSKLRDAERYEKEAESAGKEANRWQERATRFAQQEAGLQVNLTKAEQSEARSNDRERHRRQQEADRRAARERTVWEMRLRTAEAQAHEAIRTVRPPKPEKLRILILGAASAGDLRIGREQARIRRAVEAASHRELVEIDERPAATTADLLDGITKFRPHVVHFSGHSNDQLIVFEDDIDAPHQGVIVTARAFVSAVKATDDPPLLVVLNSCGSASQLDGIIAGVVPFAIGMNDEIEDADAINYAAQFYASVANGQSIASAHAAGVVTLELAGLASADTPVLASAPDVDPAAAVLVRPATAASA